MIEDESAPYDMRIHSNSSALAWTKFFREHNPECNLDDNVMLGWFANAMMAMHDHIYQSTQPEPLTPRQGLEEYKRGYARAELDLKREPLGEEESYHEAKRLYEAEDGLWYEDGFVDGLKFAEKMHGIGVDDE